MDATLTSTAAIRDFAVAVRAALGDLPDEEVEELTDGLEADLLDQAEDGGPDSELGDPLAYADELRAAAGLPLRAARPVSLRRLRYGIRDWRAAGARRIRSSALGARLLDFVVALRPVWWLLRGWALYQLAVVFVAHDVPTFLPTTGPVPWLFLLLFLLVSVQWGRGRWLAWRGLSTVKVVLSVLAVLSLPFLVTAAGELSPGYASADSGAAEPTQIDGPGLMMNGAPVYNLFAYDAEGQPLTDVQLFDQDGDPLVTTSTPQAPFLWSISADGKQTHLVPSTRVSGKPGWNVFPLNRDPLGGAAIKPAKSPFAEVQPLASAPEPSASPNPTATPVP